MILLFLALFVLFGFRGWLKTEALVSMTHASTRMSGKQFHPESLNRFTLLAKD